MFLETHLRLRESRAQRLGCELPVVIQAAAEFPRRPAPDVATPLARWAERYERWLRARGVTTNTVTFHLRNLRAVYNRSVKKRLIPASFPNPFTHLTVRQTVTRKRAPVTRNHQTDMHGRPLGAASQVLPRTRHLHVQFLHPRHVVRRYGLPAQQRHP